jgi:hypothetical protein
MHADDAKSKPSLGFLTVVHDPQFGLVGGYLILNRAARPLEFHCTAPIKPNRAQEILYGPTLEPFLYGEQIGQTLLCKSQLEPLLVCTDQAPTLAVREHVAWPVALVLRPDGPDAQAADAAQPWHRLDTAHAYRPALVQFELGRNRLAVPETNQDDRRLITERVAGLADWFDLAEPFGRIREAIEEAQRAVR